MNTQELLSQCNERLDYNPETGLLNWIKRNGQVAGSKTPVGYITIGINGSSYLAHRIAFLMAHKYLPKQVDHINGIKDDNRELNIRDSTHGQNSQNRPKFKNNASGYKGVSLNGSNWVAELRSNKKRIYIGIYTCKHEAAKAYNEAALKYHGEFAYLNKVTR